MKAQMVLDTTEHTPLKALALSSWKDGAGDGDRTRDIQLGKLNSDGCSEVQDVRK